jgi:hypothetical protein
MWTGRRGIRCRRVSPDVSGQPVHPGCGANSKTHDHARLRSFGRPKRGRTNLAPVLSMTYDIARSRLIAVDHPSPTAWPTNHRSRTYASYTACNTKWDRAKSCRIVRDRV